MNDQKIFYVYVFGLILCIITQILFGNIGIISMIFISVCVLRDFIQNQFNRIITTTRQGGIKQNGKH